MKHNDPSLEHILVRATSLNIFFIIIKWEFKSKEKLFQIVFKYNS